MDYICNNPQILYILLHGYEKDTSILSGNMLRECIKHEILARKMLSSEQDFFDLFVYVDLPNFDVASDAFLTFRELLSRHKTLVAEFLDSNYDVFIDKYRSLLSSKYVTRRQSLKARFFIVVFYCIEFLFLVIFLISRLLVVDSIVRNV